MNNKVSIITPSYNSSTFIKQTIESVLNQTYENWEMIIVDDMSTDNSVEIIESYIEKSPKDKIRLIQNKTNSGPALTRNEAIKNAKGRYIAFLDSDDLWIPQKLEKQLHFMQTNNYPFTCTYYNHMDEDGKYLATIDNIPQKSSYNSSLTLNRVGCLTAIYDADYFGKVYMDNIAKRQDYALWLNLLKKTDYVYCLPEVLADYRIRKNSVSSNKMKLIKYHWFIYYNNEKLGILKSVYCTVSYVLKTLLKKK
ncbi:glycosyltransferase family 2 protein [Tenacibaculum piscium]|uniref:Putative teichuronic acid biosynthesis glycosyltransferase TuaG n=1 Tax=Tenacibaculum piscium TaxID=1458515 RepID=A0A2H1YFM6_9FLAO|nr:glycosyltransferase family 2 protein [Tenacibaculum piscium]MBE7629133.1 glycosyltransferase [Tenacibaculum piscium]MBE7670576.1 glycosyltransferase [Tenacibaculum piscium]MBE7684844.1 glycosyltransferase [Tenacibaculum piscium]MBE7689547.1 glycosyltransferase [Tenacibaculum piscium]MCG8183413.1 glycosyltransferase family 2 protein [Tenacibaculum piscium]